MIISAGFFVILVAAAVTGIVFLAMKLQKENSDFIDDLQFFLRQRIIGHNQVKAQLAVMKTKLAKLELENIDLKRAQGKTTEDVGFSGLLGEAEFVEVRNQKIQALERELDHLRNMQMTDMAS